MADKFDIIEYLSGLTNFVFDKAVLKRIAYDRNVIDVTAYEYLSDEQKEFRQKMSKVLSDFEFKVMTMYMDGMSCAEICEATGKTAKSVDNALQRSKKKLQEVLK